MVTQTTPRQRPTRRYQGLRVLSMLWDTTLTLWITMLISSTAVLINISVIGKNSPKTLYMLGIFLPLNYVMLAIHEGLRIPALRYSSQHRHKTCNRAGTRLSLLLMMLAVLMLLLTGTVWLFQSTLASLFHMSIEQHHEAMAFIIPMLLAGIPIGCATLILSTLFGVGSNRYASLLGITGTGLNIVITWLAATYWHQGLQSIILGALSGSGFLIIAGSALLYTQGIRFSVTGGRREITQVLNDVTIMGAPVMGSFLLLFCFLSAFNYLVSFYGANEIAGFGIATRIQSFVIIPAIALGAGIAIHTNNASIAQDFQLIRPIFFVGLSFSVALYLAISVTVFLLQPYLVALFTQDEHVKGAALRYLSCISPSYLSLGVVLTLMTASEQTGQGLRVLFLNIIFYSLEIGCAALFGLSRENAKNIYLTIAIMNWLSSLYVFYELNKHRPPPGINFL